MAATQKQQPTQNRNRFISDDARWTAVERRDRRADGEFYFSVLTTGIYCRPGCPARTPHRENVRFHSSCAAAEQAGFRPCKRCQPNEVGLAKQHAAIVATACRLIENAETMPTLDVLAKAAGISRFHFHRMFKTTTGLTPKAYATAHRAQQMRDSLAGSNTVTAAIYDAGYNGNAAFYSTSAQVLGMKPASYRSGGAGMSIRFAVGECSLGSILVAATETGICAILLDDDPAVLVRDLQDRFPKARLIGADEDFEQWVAKVITLVETPAIGLDLPLDLRGTAFQQRVWQALRGIPPGITTSYTQIAERIGVPKQAVRAVAQAIAANPLAVAIPCHRVIRLDGSLAGYRWGIERKQVLLEREAAVAKKSVADN